MQGAIDPRVGQGRQRTGYRLGLFTGARIEELAQLRPEDIRQESYFDAIGVEKNAWVLSITDEGEGQGIKNIGSARWIRMHRARELLHSGESVTRVADLAGYAYIGNFSAAYRKFFGTSPSHEHRKLRTNLYATR